MRRYIASGILYQGPPPGVNFPPLHPWCRCTFEIYVEDWDKWQDDYVKRHSKNPDKILQSFRQNANMKNNGSKPFNHPDCGVLSQGDIFNFLNRDKMLAVEALGNNGKNTSIVIKTMDSDVDGYFCYISKKVEKYKSKYDEEYIRKHIDEFLKKSEEALNAAEKFGFKIIRR